MQIILRDVAAETGVALFRRFATMKAWVHSGQLRQTDILSPDGLPQNDLGYLCWADHLARALARSAGVAAPRPEDRQDERRVGKAGGSTCSFRWWPFLLK